jgi:hypothetical protein
MAQVTAGCETMAFNTNGAQPVQSISAAHRERLPCERASPHPETPVDDHRDAAIAGERQDPPRPRDLRVIGHLHESIAWLRISCSMSRGDALPTS